MERLKMMTSLATAVPPQLAVADYLAQGGYFLWLELPPGVDALALHQWARACAVSTAPGLLFSADHCFTHHLRLNVGHPGDTRFDGAIRTLGRLAADLQSGR